MEISSNFDSGNIILDQGSRSDSANQAYVRIRADKGAVFLQWFYFQVQNVQGIPLVVHMTNAHEAFSPDPRQGWSIDRSERFGKSLVSTVLMVLDQLKRK